jgi:Protein of unknown function (DUF3043)
VSPLFRRSTAPKDTEDADDQAAGSATSTEDAEGSRPKAYTPPKRRPTPKRAEAQRRRRRPEPPPASRKEAFRRSKEKQRQERTEARAGMMRGDEDYLMPRDRGPVRRLVREIVDRRRNVGPAFLLGALLVIALSGQNMPPQVRFGANVLWLGLMLTLILDATLISRRVKRLVTDRYPDSQEKWGRLYFYAFTRSTMIRRFRVPRPTVKVGEEI